MATCAVFIDRICEACGGTGKVQRGKHAFYTCSKCVGRGATREAAPDLLAALKAAVDPLELYHAYGWTDHDGVIAKVKAAIRKAEGEP